MGETSFSLRASLCYPFHAELPLMFPDHRYSVKIFLRLGLCVVRPFTSCARISDFNSLQRPSTVLGKRVPPSTAGVGPSSLLVLICTTESLRYGQQCVLFSSVFVLFFPSRCSQSSIGPLRCALHL